jgi:hypothetical protein
MQLPEKFASLAELPPASSQTSWKHRHHSRRLAHRDRLPEFSAITIITTSNNQNNKGQEIVLALTRWKKKLPSDAEQHGLMMAAKARFISLRGTRC